MREVVSVGRNTAHLRMVWARIRQAMRTLRNIAAWLLLAVLALCMFFIANGCAVDASGPDVAVDKEELGANYHFQWFDLGTRNALHDAAACLASAVSTPPPTCTESDSGHATCILHGYAEGQTVRLTGGQSPRNPNGEYGYAQTFAY